MKALVPDLAMVPRLLTRSALVMPIPVSIIVRVFASVSGMILISRSLPESSREGSVAGWCRKVEDVEGGGGGGCVGGAAEESVGGRKVGKEEPWKAENEDRGG